MEILLGLFMNVLFWAVVFSVVVIAFVAYGAGWFPGRRQRGKEASSQTSLTEETEAERHRKASFDPEADIVKGYEKLSPGVRTYHFGSIAIYRKYVTLEQVQRALAEQREGDVMRKPHRLLGDILLKNNLITEEQMKSILDEMGVGDYRGG
jgi:hypothetical protein